MSHCGQTLEPRVLGSFLGTLDSSAQLLINQPKNQIICRISLKKETYSGFNKGRHRSDTLCRESDLRQTFQVGQTLPLLELLL